MTGRLRRRSTTWIDDIRGGVRAIWLEALIVVGLVIVAAVAAAIALAVV
jgi:hypothetical protein